MKTHAFTLILSGVAELTPALADAVYAATGGDIELNLRDGVAFVEFERAASTLREAITAAIREVEGADRQEISEIHPFQTSEERLSAWAVGCDGTVEKRRASKCRRAGALVVHHQAGICIYASTRWVIVNARVLS